MNPAPANPAVIPPKDAIVPLSGNPFFTCIISKSHLPSPCQVSIPRTFYQYLPSESLPVVLSYGNKFWKMTYCGNLPKRRLYCGWEKFATDNKLKIGDGCIFELVDSKNLQFKVQILPGQLPSNLKPNINGKSCDSPIFINCRKSYEIGGTHTIHPCPKCQRSNAKVRNNN
ncbi:putative transcription factor B3-Domain family [Dioscorea sansibarensis]